MDLSTLTPAKGSVKSKKRIGRGQGSGRGGTSTKGHKGAKSRSGYKTKKGFEGGQMPLQRRLPKFGFRNPNRVAYKALNLGDIQAMTEKFKLKEVNLEVLRDHGFAGKNDRIKVLAKGELKAKVNVEAHAFSATAKEAIESAGGTVTTIE